MSEYRPNNIMVRNRYNCQPMTNNYMRPAGNQKPCDCKIPKEGMYDNNDDFPVGMAYVPWQKFGEVYELDAALKNGTIFPELDKKFYGAGGACQ